MLNIISLWSWVTKQHVLREKSTLLLERETKMDSINYAWRDEKCERATRLGIAEDSEQDNDVEESVSTWNISR
jgi:hypothetical protein